METSGDLLVEGRCDGDIFVGGTITVGRTGICRAVIRARAAVVHGEVIGGIVCAETLTIVQGARVVGDIRAPEVDVAPGAHLEGKVDLLPSAPADEGPARIPLAVRTLRGAPRPIPLPPSLRPRNEPTTP